MNLILTCGEGEEGGREKRETWETWERGETTQGRIRWGRGGVERRPGAGIAG